MANRAAQVGDTGSLQDWYRDVPPITKFFITGTMLAATGATFGLLGFIGGESGLTFDWYSISSKFHVWRLITPFIYAGPFGLNFVFHMMILYENCRRYESNPYNTGAGGTTADFFYMLVLGGGFLILLELFFGFGMLSMSEPILHMIVYVWSRRDAELQVNIWGVKFKAMYLPWVYVGIRVVLNASPKFILLGIVVGHLYYFLAEVCPAQHGYTLIKTPKWCVDFVSFLAYQTRGTPNVLLNPMQQRHQPPVGTADTTTNTANGLRNRSTQYSWGRGNVLGTNN